MNWYEKIKKYYNAGYYTTQQMRLFVDAKKITKEEYKEITGQDY